MASLNTVKADSEEKKILINITISNTCMVGCNFVLQIKILQQLLILLLVLYPHIM